MSDPPPANAASQVQWEARWGRAAGGAAIGAAALAAASTVVQLSIGGARPDDRREALIQFDGHRAEYLLSLALQGVAYFLLAAALFYLLRATMARRTETPNWSIGLLLLAPVLLGIGGVVSQIELGRVAEEFVTSGPQTNDRAKDLLKDQSIAGGAIGYGGILSLALSYVIVSLHAMRAGLLSRFMGVLGIIVGGLLVLPLLPGGQSVVQVFWLVAVGVLFMGFWPNGRGPAWETGEAVPWPSPADTRAERLDATDASGQGEAGGPDEGTPRPASRKRKRRNRPTG